MSLSRIFAGAFIRKLAFIAAAALVAVVLSMFGIGNAHAQVAPQGCGDTSLGWGNPAPDPPICADEGEANEFSRLAALAAKNSQAPTTAITQDLKATQSCSVTPIQGVFYCYIRWQIKAGLTYFAERKYPSNNTCTTRNVGLGLNGAVKWKPGSDKDCLSGCEYKIVSGLQTRSVSANSPGQISVRTGVMYGGTWEYSGPTCQNVPGIDSGREKEKQTKPECVPAGSGRTYCVKPNNDFCATASSGRTFCWTPGLEGTKTDGPNTQTIQNGNQPPSPPPGSTHTNTTNISNVTNSSTSNTTINNYTTNSGEAAGPTNEGTGADADGVPGGSGSGTPGGTGTGTGGEDDEGDDESSSGGSGCESPPVSTGSPLLGAIIQQTYATKCAIKEGLGSLKGEGQCSDQGTVVAFSCSGDTVGCALALRARERGCKEAQANANLIADGTKDQGDEPDGSLWGEPDGTGNLDAGLISMAGGQLVPIVQVEGVSWDLNEPVDDFASKIRFVIVAMFAVWAMFIVGGKPS